MFFLFMHLLSEAHSKSAFIQPIGPFTKLKLPILHKLAAFEPTNRFSATFHKYKHPLTTTIPSTNFVLSFMDPLHALLLDQI